MAVRSALLAMASTGATTAAAQTAGVQLYAAGSLREALTEVARNFETESGQKVALTFGASGLLRERIEKGEPAQVFASADTDHPQRLTQAGGCYQGVPLKELLDRAGLRPGRRDIRKAIALLTAKDGYQASFSWGELYNSALGDGVIVVLRQANDELLDTDGLPALRSLQDLRPGPRHVRWLVRIDVQLPTER